MAAFVCHRRVTSSERPERCGRIFFPVSSPAWSSGSSRRQLPPMECDVRKNEGAKDSDEDDDALEGGVIKLGVGRNEIQRACADEGKGDCVRADHPLAMLRYMAIACGDEGEQSAEHPEPSLRDLREDGEDGVGVPGKDQGGWRGDKDRTNIDTSEDAVQPEMLPAQPRGELQGTYEGGCDSTDGVWNEEQAIVDELEKVGVGGAGSGAEKGDLREKNYGNT